MDEDILIIIASTVTVLGGMSILLTAWWLWLRNKGRRALSPDDVAHLRRAIEDVRLEMDAVHRTLSDGQQELHERLDFAERLLAQRQPEAVAPPKDERH